ncbi:MAG: hypothetical protein D6706_18330 [Chloroflexi bacterium]|nr:MAG: hypothetical protein D6706_18330 [Chloroflexota bacterium]
MHDVGEQIAFSRESELQLTVVQFDNTATSTIRVVIIKTTCHPHKQKTLQKQFLAGKTRLGENLALLQPGEGEVIINGHPFLATWT